MSLLGEISTVDDLRARVAKLQEQIDQRHDEIDAGIVGNSSGNKDAITRWGETKSKSYYRV